MSTWNCHVLMCYGLVISDIDVNVEFIVMWSIKIGFTCHQVHVEFIVMWSIKKLGRREDMGQEELLPGFVKISQTILLWNRL